MEDSVRNLLVGIGQPAFPYRNFGHADHSGLLEKWPLMALIVAKPEVRGEHIGQIQTEPKRGAPGVASIRNARDNSASRSGLLSNYGSNTRPLASAKSGDEAAQDVRSLLGRLSENSK